MLGVAIMVLSVASFAYYLAHHGYLLKQLAHTPLLLLFWVFLLYGGVFVALALILEAGVRMCRVKLPARENLLLNSYSMLVNFFVIGQAGPGVRAAYLKKKHGLLVRRYIFVTLLYYACYAVVSALLMLLGSSAAWWLTLLAVLLVAGASALVVYWYQARSKLKHEGLQLNAPNLLYLLLATVLQALLQISVYWLELHHVNAHVTLRQTVAYTGVANMALFVSLTPGAIGIRESFLVFSERLHHISSANIVSANLIDRSVYILFLGVLFAVTVSFHVKEKLSLKAPTSRQPEA